MLYFGLINPSLVIIYFLPNMILIVNNWNIADVSCPIPVQNGDFKNEIIVLIKDADNSLTVVLIADHSICK